MPVLLSLYATRPASPHQRWHIGPPLSTSGTCRRGGSDSPYGAAPAARRGVIEPYRDGARARPLREEPFAAPGWTLAGEPRLTVGGTELVAQALIATTGTPAAGVETTSAPPS